MKKGFCIVRLLLIEIAIFKNLVCFSRKKNKFDLSLCILICFIAIGLYHELY